MAMRLPSRIVLVAGVILVSLVGGFAILMFKIALQVDKKNEVIELFGKVERDMNKRALAREWSAVLDQCNTLDGGTGFMCNSEGISRDVDAAPYESIVIRYFEKGELIARSTFFVVVNPRLISSKVEYFK